MTSADEVFDRDVTDPLSDVTRSDRRWLLLVNVVLAAMAYGGIVPSEIEALGLKTAQINRHVMFAIVWVAGLYLAISFTLYVTTDYKTWGMRMRQARRRFIDAMLEVDAAIMDDGDSQPQPEKLREFTDLFDARMRPFRRRTLFEMYVPLVVSLINLPATALFMMFA